MNKKTGQPASPPSGEPIHPARTALPPEMDKIARRANLHSAEARELFTYALALLLVDQRKATIITRQPMGERERVVFRSSSGNSFAVVRPLVSEMTLKRVEVLARIVLRLEKR